MKTRSLAKHPEMKTVVSTSDIVDHGIDCELDFAEVESADGKLMEDMIDVDKDSDGCRCGSSPGERSSSVYSSPSDISPTPPPSVASGPSSLNHLNPHYNYNHSTNKRPSLDLTKEHLKEFVSRWTDNPYLFDSPRGVITHVNNCAAGDYSDNINCITSQTAAATNTASSMHTSPNSLTTIASTCHHHTTQHDSNNNSSKTCTEVTTSQEAGEIVRNHDTNNNSKHDRALASTDRIVSEKRNSSKARVNLVSSSNESSCAGTNCNHNCPDENHPHDGMDCKIECGLNIVSQIRRFSQQLHEELELMKKQCGSCNAIRKYSLSDVSVNAQ